MAHRRRQQRESEQLIKLGPKPGQPHGQEGTGRLGPGVARVEWWHRAGQELPNHRWGQAGQQEALYFPNLLLCCVIALITKRTRKAHIWLCPKHLLGGGSVTLSRLPASLWNLHLEHALASSWASFCPL